jgi:hypothetical protein
VARSRNPVGDFNTAGQGKCQHCGDWFPEAWVQSHRDSCARNPNPSAPSTGSDPEGGEP